MRPELGRTQYLGSEVLEVAGRMTDVGVDVLLGSSSLDLEGDRRAGRVGEAQDLGDFMGERAWVQGYVSRLVAKLAIWPADWAVGYTYAGSQARRARVRQTW